MRSFCCLFKRLGPVMNISRADPFQEHKIQCIMGHLELKEGEEWDTLCTDLVHKQCLELTDADSKRLRMRSEEYQAIKMKRRTSEKELKVMADKEMEENMHDLMNKLNLYK